MARLPHHAKVIGYKPEKAVEEPVALPAVALGFLPLPPDM